MFGRSTKPVPYQFANQARQTGLRFDRTTATFKRAAMVQENTVPREPVPIAGTTVSVENADSRYTVTRFATLGVFALALKKNTNYLVFTTGDGMEYMARVRGMNYGQAQQWARQFNNLSRSLSTPAVKRVV